MKIRRGKNSAKSQDGAIEELLVVENAEENRGHGLQQPRAHRLAFGIQQALHAGYGVGVLEFVLHSRILSGLATNTKAALVGDALICTFSI